MNKSKPSRHHLSFQSTLNTDVHRRNNQFIPTQYTIVITDLSRHLYMQSLYIYDTSLRSVLETHLTIYPEEITSQSTPEHETDTSVKKHCAKHLFFVGDIQQTVLVDKLQSDLYSMEYSIYTLPK